MKYRLRILQPYEAVNSFGEKTPQWKEARTVHAERVKFSGRRSQEVGEGFPDYRAEWNIRDCHPVDENWRVEQLGGHLYTVVSIIPNIDRGMLTLVCERVNP